MTRVEHIKWCKERAIAEYDYYAKTATRVEALRNGMASMMSDLGKHEETNDRSLQELCLFQMMMTPQMDRQSFVNFINGFN